MSEPFLPNTCAVRFEGRYAVLRCPYDADFLEDFHGCLPPRSHRWDKWHREWWIDVTCWNEVAPIVERYFGAKLPLRADRRRA